MHHPCLTVLAALPWLEPSCAHCGTATGVCVLLLKRSIARMGQVAVLMFRLLCSDSVHWEVCLSSVKAMLGISLCVSNRDGTVWWDNNSFSCWCFLKTLFSCIIYVLYSVHILHCVILCTALFCGVNIDKSVCCSMGSSCSTAADCCCSVSPSASSLSPCLLKRPLRRLCF